ncbi:hypothetical protein KFK09_005048 [Dendrobium nobile]|uniref:Uncharacterized protein n=1 Tax=Dendrobium nobile TaxID=94219 RepID=A0A8T3BZJ0_DENNO|nr:hypothetical protein KFK09_005048 [Dendrobium nobile]
MPPVKKIGGHRHHDRQKLTGGMNRRKRFPMRFLPVAFKPPKSHRFRCNAQVEKLKNYKEDGAE